jgi:hypothetical protein
MSTLGTYLPGPTVVLGQGEPVGVELASLPAPALGRRGNSSAAALVRLDDLAGATANRSTAKPRSLATRGALHPE